jgi:diguanylate cyclase (GGDEF)-like protein
MTISTSTGESPIRVCNGRPIIRPTGIDNKADYSIIVVDDERVARVPIVAALRSDGYERIYEAGSASELEKLLEQTDPALILMDLDLGKSPNDGLELMEKIDAEGKTATNYIVVSGNAEKEYMLRAFRQRAMDFLEKPVDHEVLKIRVEKALVDIEFRTMALTDSMTKIANKGTFRQYLEHEIASFPRNHRQLSLVVMDIDNFKKYNDTYGHLEGDYVLKKAANFFPTRLRQSDLVARYGGEEFVIVMPETPFDKAFTTFGRVYYKFRNNLFQPKEKVEIPVTLSAGISTLDETTYDAILQGRDLKDANVRIEFADAMIRCADNGLYEIKSHGKNGCYPGNCLEEFYKPVK